MEYNIEERVKKENLKPFDSCTVYAVQSFISPVINLVFFSFWRQIKLMLPANGIHQPTRSTSTEVRLPANTVILLWLIMHFYRVHYRIIITIASSKLQFDASRIYILYRIELVGRYLFHIIYIRKMQCLWTECAAIRTHFTARARSYIMILCSATSRTRIWRYLSK